MHKTLSEYDLAEDGRGVINGHQGVGDRWRFPLAQEDESHHGENLYYIPKRGIPYDISQSQSAETFARLIL